MVQAYVSIGSNIEPDANVRDAICLLKEKALLTGISTIYKTMAEERPEQPHFYNGIVQIDAEVGPQALKWGVLRRIEEQLGRKRTSDKWAPRTIDLDIVMFGDISISSEGLVIPDPDIFRRYFIAAPLAELSPDLIIPGSDIRVSELAGRLPQNQAEPLNEYTARIRSEFLSPV